MVRVLGDERDTGSGGLCALLGVLGEDRHGFGLVGARGGLVVLVVVAHGGAEGTLGV